MRDIRKLKRVKILASDMNLRGFNLHKMVKPGYIFGVKRAYKANTPSKTLMFELCGATGKTFEYWAGNPVRYMKIMSKWTRPISTKAYLWNRYGPNPLRVLVGALRETFV